MENKINVAELLKDCPKGMELDCTMFEQPVRYMGLTKNETYIIAIQTSYSRFFSLTKEGYLYDTADSKCIVFPKGKTTWEGFMPPFKFKDGDIIAMENECGIHIFIYNYTTNEYNGYGYYVIFTGLGNFKINGFCGGCTYRLATEEEKEKLFNAIKANGYKWNADSKTLEKLVEPKFKVGDKVRHKNNHGVVFTITSIGDDTYVCGAKAAFWFDDQDDYELVPNKFDITTLKPFDEVLVRNTNNGRWRGQFYMSYDKNEEYPFECAYNCWMQCIPYEGNEHLMGKTNDCDEFYKTWE